MVGIGVSWFFLFEEKKSKFSRKNFFFRKIFFYTEIIIRMFWNRNMLLTDIRRTSCSLLMTFWKIFKIGMTFFQNFRKKSSATRKFFKKLSKVTQIRFSNSLTTYSGFRAFWWLFLNLSSFPWILKKKKFFSSKSLMKSRRKIFFLLKIEKSRVRLPSQLYSKYFLNVSDIW